MTDFIADSEEESETEELPNSSKQHKLSWEKVIVDVSSPVRSSKDMIPISNGSAWVPKVNGKHNKHVQHVSLKTEGELLSQENGFSRILPANTSLYKEVLPGLESWQAGKIAAWHNLEGHSVLWFCVVCIDRKGNTRSEIKAL